MTVSLLASLYYEPSGLGVNKIINHSASRKRIATMIYDLKPLRNCYSALSEVAKAAFLNTAKNFALAVIFRGPSRSIKPSVSRPSEPSKSINGYKVSIGKFLTTEDQINLEQAFYGARLNRAEKKAVIVAQLKELNYAELNSWGLDFTSQASFKLNLSNSNITDVELQGIIRRLPNIVELNLKSCSQITNNCLAAISNLKKLEKLNLSKNSQVNDLSSLNNNLPNLKHLDLSECSGIRDFSGISRCTSLEHLDLGSSSIERLNSLEGLVNLKHLNLSYTSVGNSDVFSNFTQLEHLDLSWCLNFDDLQPLAGLVKLEGLNIGGRIPIPGLPSISNIQPLSNLVNLRGTCKNKAVS